MPLRLLLGLLEAGTCPGAAYLLSCWYCRFELQKRNSLFVMMGMVAQAFAGILAYGLIQMGGLASIAGWRWILIIEGVATCVVAIGAYWMLVDFPELATKSWRFLDQKQVDFVVARIEKDRADVIPDPFSWKVYLSHAKDIHICCWSFISLCVTTNTYALSFFMPIILQQSMGFGVAESQCLTAPPYVGAAIFMMVEGWLGDKYQLRGH